MHLLAREETGLRCLLRVALEGRLGEPVPIAQIAAREGLSNVYAAKILRQLRLAGLVDSTRGAAGGYRLTRDADEITVWDTIQALDPNFLPGATCECEPADRIDCRRTTDCAVSSLWRRLGDQIRRQLSTLTLAELCRGALERPERIELPVSGPSAISGPIEPRTGGRTLGTIHPNGRRAVAIEGSPNWPSSN